MNPSRISYSYSLDSNLDQIYSKDVILKSCEFCSRTFIPDSLARHRKICYKDFLKKRSNISKKSRQSRSKSNKMNTGDLSEMNVTELMIKRQLRRMQWRGRHEEFIQSIREAREYAIASNCGLKIPVPSVSMDQEDMEQCKYCLRKFHKNSFEKHLGRCKEYSIQSIRSRPNEAQIEAKRRLSLRLYYKPKSYRGDSPDDFSTSFSSNDLDCTYNSQGISNRKSRASISVNNSICSKNSSKVKRQSSVAIHKSQISLESHKIKRHKSTVLRKPRESVKSPSLSICQSQSKSMKTNRLPFSQSRIGSEKNSSYYLTKSKEEILNQYSTIGKTIQNKNSKNFQYFDNISLKGQESIISVHSTESEKIHLKKERISDKLKVISNLLTNTSSNNSSRFCNQTKDMLAKIQIPNPAESLRKAKEILNFLDLRIQQNELSSETRSFLLGKDHEDLNPDNQGLSCHTYDDEIAFVQSNEICTVNKPIANPYAYSDVFHKKFKTDHQGIGKMNNCIELESKYERTFGNFDDNGKMTDNLDKYLETKEVITNKGSERQTNDVCNPSVIMTHIDPEYAKAWKKLK